MSLPPARNSIKEKEELPYHAPTSASKALIPAPGRSLHPGSYYYCPLLPLYKIPPVAHWNLSRFIIALLVWGDYSIAALLLWKFYIAIPEIGSEDCAGVSIYFV